MKRCVFASMGGDLLFLLSALLPLLSLLLSSLMPRGNFLETATQMQYMDANLIWSPIQWSR